MSGVMIHNGISRLVTYRPYLKINIGAIPSAQSDNVFKFKTIEVGDCALGRLVVTKTASAVFELKSIVSATFPLHATLKFLKTEKQTDIQVENTGKQCQRVASSRCHLSTTLLLPRMKSTPLLSSIPFTYT